MVWNAGIRLPDCSWQRTCPRGGSFGTWGFRRHGSHVRTGTLRAGHPRVTDPSLRRIVLGGYPRPASRPCCWQVSTTGRHPVATNGGITDQCCSGQSTLARVTSPASTAFRQADDAPPQARVANRKQKPGASIRIFGKGSSQRKDWVGSLAGIH